jgi:tetratricopeptide (TPR) repeat protein
MRFKAVTLGFVLAGTTLASAALNLGRVKGAAWIGQPLDVQLQAQIDPGQAEGTLCAEADVFHGDSRQDAGRVQVQVTPTDATDTFNIRITSSALIDEPVVTVYLRAGCNQKISRKFVLLADFPSDASASLARVNAPATQVVPTVTAVEATAQTQGAAQPVAPASAVQSPLAKAASGRTKTSTSTKAAARERAHQPVDAVAEPATPKVVGDKSAKADKPSTPQSKDAPTGKPRLRLDPIETLTERVKSLESSTTSSTASPTSAEPGGDGQKMQQLQSDLKSLLDQATKNEAALAAMRERLEKAESERVPVAMVYALLVLVLACVAALAAIWTKRPRRVVWDESSQTAQASFDAPQGLRLEDDALDSVQPQAQDVLAETMHPVHIDLPKAAGVIDQAPKIPATEPNKPALPKTRHHNFQTESLLDLRQHAELLTNLGRIDEAIEMLAAAIHNSPSESPLLFLDLLDIANSYDRKPQFLQYRDEFTQLFNVAVPEFALFKNEGRKLDAYPALLEHIDSQWESPRVLDIIEACLMRDPDVSESDPFDLAAFRELLNMHGVAHAHHAHNA